jgi:hypothetical protein
VDGIKPFRETLVLRRAWHCETKSEENSWGESNGPEATAALGDVEKPVVFLAE